MNQSEIPKEINDVLVKHYTCALLHSRIPKKEKDGSIKWVCKEGCENDNE